jgi:hypothetical protein
LEYRIVGAQRLVHVTIKVRALPAWTAQDVRLVHQRASVRCRTEGSDCRYGFTAGAAHEAIKFLVWESYSRQRQSFCPKVEPLAAVKLAFGFYKQG